MRCSCVNCLQDSVLSYRQRSGKRNFKMANQSRSPTGERLKMDLRVQEAEMNNYPSNNFSTVFFLVVLFIGMGVLGYHAYEITLENGQLNEDVKTLQTNVASLNTENAALKTENSTLKSENTTLKTEKAAITNENRMLKTELVKEVSKNIFLDTPDTDKIAELEKLRSENSNLKVENLQLKAIGNRSDGSSPGDIEVLQSTILPITAILLISYNIYVLFNDIWRKKAVLTGKSRNPHIIESRFIER